MQASILDRILTVGLFTLTAVSYVAWYAQAAVAGRPKRSTQAAQYPKR